MASHFTVFIMGVFLTVSSVSCISLKVKGDADTFDWRTKGAISPVTNQGEVGSTVAIVLAEGVESLHAIQNGTPVAILSRKEVADCCLDEAQQPKYKGYDCFLHIGGLCSQAAYISDAGKCNNASCSAVGKITKTGYIPENREDLMVNIIHQTPLTAYIDASMQSFLTYTSGVYSDPDCSKTLLDHEVQIVGYGTTGGVDYWIIKNSWGVSWGDKGYINIVRGKNMCGIAAKVYYPINEH